MAQRKAENHISDTGEVFGPALWKAADHSGLRRKGVLRCFIHTSRKAKQRRAVRVRPSASLKKSSERSIGKGRCFFHCFDFIHEAGPGRLWLLHSLPPPLFGTALRLWLYPSGSPGPFHRAVPAFHGRGADDVGALCGPLVEGKGFFIALGKAFSFFIELA